MLEHRQTTDSALTSAPPRRSAFFAAGNGARSASKIRYSVAPDSTYFPALSAADRELLAAYGTLKTYGKNALIAHEGDRSDSLFIVLSGSVRLYVSEPDGKELTLGLLGPASCFGELDVIEDEPRSASAISLEVTTLAVIPKPRFIDCLAAHPQLSNKLLNMLAKRARHLIWLAKNLALASVYGRVVNVLRVLAEEDNNHSGVSMVPRRLTHKALADMIGTSREMVSRAMKSLTDDGYICTATDRIVIQKPLPVSERI